MISVVDWCIMDRVLSRNYVPVVVARINLTPYIGGCHVYLAACLSFTVIAEVILIWIFFLQKKKILISYPFDTGDFLIIHAEHVVHSAWILF